MRRRNSSTRGGSMDLAKFLEARIADDEAAAKAAFGPGLALNSPALPAAVDGFVDRYAPLRAVRQAAANRMSLAEHHAYAEIDRVTHRCHVSASDRAYHNG